MKLSGQVQIVEHQLNRLTTVVYEINYVSHFGGRRQNVQKCCWFSVSNRVCIVTGGVLYYTTTCTTSVVWFQWQKHYTNKVGLFMLQYMCWTSYDNHFISSDTAIASADIAIFMFHIQFSVSLVIVHMQCRSSSTTSTPVTTTSSTSTASTQWVDV